MFTAFHHLMSEPSLFRHYQIVQDAEGSNVELIRTTEQVCVLAFDNQRLEFVHCHVLLEPLANRPMFEESCRKLQQRGHPLLAGLVDCGEDDGNPFYITTNVDGETLRGYLQRQSEIPLWLAVMVATRSLEAAIALCQRGDFLTEQPLDSFRVVQVSTSALQVVVADFRVLDSVAGKGRNRLVKANFERQAKFLRAFLHEQGGGGGPTLPDAMLPAVDFAEMLGGVMATSGPGLGSLMADLVKALRKLAPDHLAGEIPTAQKPRALVAPLLASYQEVARGVVNVVRIQSQRLDMANPYSMRGTLTRTGRAVLVEQVPPRRLCGVLVEETDKLVQKLGKKRDYASLVPLPLVSETEGLTCLAEEMVDGVALADVIRERGGLGVSETYLVLAGMDAALTQLERAGLATRKLRLEDMFLLTGFNRDDPRSNRLLTTRLNEWPSFTVMLRAHPTLASMSGRGVDPGVLLPPVNSKAAVWHGGWMAAVGMVVLGLDESALEAGASREMEAVSRLLEDELARTREQKMTGRSDFLARFARVIQHHDLAAAGSFPAASPAPVAEPAKPKAEGRLPARRPKLEPMTPMAAEPMSPVALSMNLSSALTAGIDPEGEKSTIGFAELLFQSPPTAPARPAGRWGQGASADMADGQIAGWGAEERDGSPWWLKATVFLAGSMLAGALCAHLSGEAQWQKGMLHNTPASPAAKVLPAKRP